MIKFMSNTFRIRRRIIMIAEFGFVNHGVGIGASDIRL
jgi:hypothetical protein